MAEVRAKSRAGVETVVDAPNGLPLMDALRDANLDVEAICGGACSCGTCHVYVAANWIDKLPPRSEDEQAMLEAIGDLVEVRPGSRLSCQIQVSEELAGLSVEIGPVP